MDARGSQERFNTVNTIHQRKELSVTYVKMALYLRQLETDVFELQQLTNVQFTVNLNASRVKRVLSIIKTII